MRKLTEILFRHEMPILWVTLILCGGSAFAGVIVGSKEITATAIATFSVFVLVYVILSGRESLPNQD